MEKHQKLKKVGIKPLADEELCLDLEEIRKGNILLEKSICL